MTALTLLMPGTPMLFMGQEFAASSGFHYFADHNSALAAKVAAGRAKFLEQFPSIATPEMQSRLRDPAAPETFERCKLDHAERLRGDGAEAFALHRDLLRLRREDGPFDLGDRAGFDGAVLGTMAFVLRWFGVDGDDRILLVNLGADLVLEPAPEPLLAPPDGCRWAVVWSSESPIYGGNGTAAVEAEDGLWRLPGEAAVVLRGEPARTSPPDAQAAAAP
jgi:maltooligosyltrehalose trehalohydrolase